MRLHIYQIGGLDPKNKEFLIVFADHVWCTDDCSLPAICHVK